MKGRLTLNRPARTLLLSFLLASCAPRTIGEGRHYSSGYPDQNLLVCEDKGLNDTKYRLEPVSNLFNGSNSLDLQFEPVNNDLKPPIRKSDWTINYNTLGSGAWAEGMYLSKGESHLASFANGNVLATNHEGVLDIEVSCGGGRTK